MDLLLWDPADESMYEVETTLGDTDPSHIIRTIEYWDLTKRKWPQRQHFAVLVAERITKRFFNVIQILSGSIPLIAVQVNVIKSPAGEQYLHFTKILDIYEEPDPPAGIVDGSFDEAYWKRQTNATLDFANEVLKLTTPAYGNARLGYCKSSINIVSDGYNQLVLRPRSGGNLMVEFRYGPRREEIAHLLEARSIQYREKNNHFIFSMSMQRAKEDIQLFAEIAKRNNRWWLNNGDIA